MAKKIVIDLEVKSKKGVKEVEKLNKEVAKTSKEVAKTKKEIKDANKQNTALGANAVGAFNKFKGAVLGVVRGFKSLKFAIIATGIGALLVGILAVKTAFTSSEEGQNKYAKLMGVIGSITGNLIDLLAKFGEGIISVFENPKQAILDFKDLLIKQVTNRISSAIETIGFLGTAIKKVFKGDFSGAMESAKKAGNSYIDTLTGVKNTIDKVTQATRDFANEISEEAKIAANIADQRAKADKIERRLIVERAKANKEIADLRFKSEQRDKFSASERVAFLKEASLISEEIAAKEIASNKLRLDAKIAENKLNKSDKADLDEVARLKARSIELDTAKLTLQKRLQTSLTSFQNEEKAGIKAIQDKKNKENQEAEKTETKRLESIEKIQEDFKKKKEDKDAETQIQKIELEQTRALEELDRLNATEEQKANIKLHYAGLITDEETKNEKQKEKLDKLRVKQTLGDAKNTFNQIAQLAGKDSKVGKAMAIASATISGVQGVQNAYSTAQKSPITLGFPAYPLVQAGLAGAIALKNITAIKSVNPSGGGSANVPAPAAVSSAPPAFNVVGASGTNQLASAIGGQSQQPVQAYVVANDVTTSQSMERNIVEDASIGG